jgi:hypothetical protein
MDGKAWRAMRKAQGLCQDCSAPIIEFTRCLDCRRERASYHRKKRTNKTYIHPMKEHVSPYAGMRRCIRCDEYFRSWDRRLNQVCQACTVQVDWLSQEASYG